MVLIYDAPIPGGVLNVCSFLDRWLSLPAIICLVGAAVPIFIFVLQVSRCIKILDSLQCPLCLAGDIFTDVKSLSREYTVTCTYDPSLEKGSCGSSYLAQAVSD